MKTDIQTINFDASADLLDAVNGNIDKLSALEKDITEVDVYLKTVNDQQDRTKNVEMRLFVPGNDLYAEYQAESFDEALQQTYQKLRKQLVKRKEMIRNRN